MIIDISNRQGKFCADIINLTGSPYVGLAETKELAVAQVFWYNRERINEAHPDIGLDIIINDRTK